MSSLERFFGKKNLEKINNRVIWIGILIAVVNLSFEPLQRKLDLIVLGVFSAFCLIAFLTYFRNHKLKAGTAIALMAAMYAVYIF
ncbi:hypothetical protein [Bacillus infantis]|uniref:Uncharacterized protein n=1 Tax=Bacillus infantis TaxID=324767 RepID=A0A5D4R6V0_9BACI|nr:hypothetical protein [Bacillus infantis]TYS45696.1 hypothetical protein FZD51_19200 [Bacillus infantis]